MSHSSQINTRRLTNHARRSLAKAESIAKKFKYRQILSIHLLYAIYLEKGSIGSNMLLELELSRNEILKILKDHAPKSSARPNAIPANNLKRALVRAYAFAKKFNCTYVGTEHLVYSIISLRDPVLKKISFKAPARNASEAGGSVRSRDESFFSSSEMTSHSFMEPAENFAYLSRIFTLSPVSRPGEKSSSALQTPYINKFCANISEEAEKKEEFIIGREKELERMISILGRKNKNNPILVGEPGVGKTALVSGLALLISKDQVPEYLHQKRIMSLDIAQLVAGTSFRGEFESRLKEIIKEASFHQEVILFIDEIHNIIGAGNVPGSLDLTNILKPALGKGEIRVIGATTLGEYGKYIEKDSALERRFQPVYIGEPALEEAKNILRGIKTNYESFHNVIIADEAIESAVDLSARYIQNRQLPDKAIDVLDEAAAHIRSKQKISHFQKQIRSLEKEYQRILDEKEHFVSQEDFEHAIEAQAREKEIRNKIDFLRQKQSDPRQKQAVRISDRDVALTVAKISGVPADKLLQEQTSKIRDIKDTLAANIIGQPEAIQKLSYTLLRSQSGISNPERPLGSFLFLGPTGVGKTLTAKILAREFFGSKNSLIRIDMSELMEHHSVASLIGSPAGYIGYGEGGNLTEKVRRNPYSVVLFDEFEKAHSNISNLLLQILEDGILTDAGGLQVSFKNTVIILTSNIGTEEISSPRLGFGANKDFFLPEFGNTLKENAFRELERRMKPELLNRFDHVIVFNPLTKKEIARIAALELEKISQRIKKSGILITWNDSVIQFLADKSIALNQGARLVRKNIQEYIENPIAEMMMRDEIEKERVITIKLKNNKVTLEAVK